MIKRIILTFGHDFIYCNGCYHMVIKVFAKKQGFLMQTQKK